MVQMGNVLGPVEEPFLLEVAEFVWCSSMYQGFQDSIVQ